LDEQEQMCGSKHRFGHVAFKKHKFTLNFVMLFIISLLNGAFYSYILMK